MLANFPFGKKYVNPCRLHRIYEEYFARQIYWIQKSGVVESLLDIQTKHLLDIFNAVKVSNHLLVFNLEMAQIFIFPGVKEHLDRLYGYPPNNVVEKFQQRLKATIKALDRYSDFIKAIKFDDKIRSPEDLIELFKRSIQISNKQGYTTLLSNAELQDRRFDQQTQYNRQQNRYYSGNGKR